MSANHLKQLTLTIPPKPKKIDGLDFCLEQWQCLMHLNDRDLKIKSASTLRGDGDGYGNPDVLWDFNHEIADAVDAAVGELKHSHRWAIRITCGLASVWAFPQLDLISTAQAARAELERKLRKNCVAWVAFA